MIEKSNTVFFLGGRDLEMEEIARTLQERGWKYHDKRLPWGANLSAYSEELAALPPGAVPVLIELGMDTEVPPGATIIDHHGDRAGRDSNTSLEQVAEIIGWELNRDQMLISANDRGHVRGMLDMGATWDEVARIRERDRRSQGITERDEELAMETVATRIEEPFPGVAMIKSKTPRFTAVIDKVWQRYPIVVIFNDDQMCVYGPGRLVEQLKSSYQELGRKDAGIKWWSGGYLPESGFFGSNHFAKKEVLSLAETNGSPYSQHVFLFPFVIEPKTNGAISGISVKEALDSLRSDEWDYPPYSMKSGEDYSEYAYFHQYVRDAIFEDKKELFNENFEPVFVSCRLEHLKRKKGTFVLRIKEGKDVRTYILRLDEVSLRVFKTGVFVLSFVLLNHDYKEFDHIRRINDFGRRVYPQFLTDSTDQGININVVKGEFLPDSISLSFDGGASPINELFLRKEFFKEGANYIRVGRHIIDTLGAHFTKAYKVIPVIDDRMYTICWYWNSGMCEMLAGPRSGRAFETNKDWYRFLFLDGKDCCCPDDRSRAALIEKTTYARWSNKKLYGVTRYSMMCLTNSDFATARMHMRRHYRIMAEILLAQRSSIIAFSTRVSKISADIDLVEGATDRKTIDRIAENTRRLHGDYIGFINQLWFSEVTPQEQGIEMYEMGLRNMALPAQIGELKEEIKELNEYVEMQQQRRTNDFAQYLTITGTIVLFISVVLAAWSLSPEFIERVEWSIPRFSIGSLAVFGSVLLAGSVAGLIIRWQILRKGR